MEGLLAILFYNAASNLKKVDGLSCFSKRFSLLFMRQPTGRRLQPPTAK